MKAVSLAAFGGPEVLQIIDMPKPVPGTEQLLVKVRAAGINRADLLQRAGKHPPPVGESEILGLELAGDIVACGDAVSGFEVGQAAFGLVAGGAYAEYCLLDQGLAMAKPSTMSYQQAAALPEVFFTANEILFQYGQLASGETVLIHAGASGVGTAALQLVEQHGANAFFTTSTEAKIEKVMAITSAHGINYNKQDFAEVIAAETGGVDVIIDFIGAPYFKRHLDLLNIGGRLVQVAFLGGAKAELVLPILMHKRLQLKGFMLRNQSLREKREIATRFKNTCLPLIEQGKMKPVIDKVFPLADVRAAHEYMASNQHVGKIILDMT